MLNFSLEYVYEQYARIQALPSLLTGDIDYANCISCVVAFQPTNMGPGYVRKPSDSKSPVLEVCLMWSTPSLPLVPGYKKIISYLLDGCVPWYGEAEVRRRRQDREDLSMGFGHREMKKRLVLHELRHG